MLRPIKSRHQFPACCDGVMDVHQQMVETFGHFISPSTIPQLHLSNEWNTTLIHCAHWKSVTAGRRKMWRYESEKYNTSITYGIS